MNIHLFPEATALLNRHMAIRNGEIVECDGLSLEISPTVLSPAHTRTSVFFARNVRLRRGASLLEVGVGSGFLVIKLAQQFSLSDLHATDVNPESITLAKRNFARHDIRCELHLGSLFAPVPKRHYDYIMFNPPLLAVPAFGATELERAVFDEDGQVLGGFMNQVGRYMHATTTAYVLHTNRQDYATGEPGNGRLCGLAREAGLTCEVTATLDVGYEIYSVHALRRTGHESI